jgi:DNA-binding NtrC family response regulator
VSGMYPRVPVLVVDDESSIRSTVRLTLRLSGITNVEECDSADAVRAAIRDRSFPVVILDLVMPGVTGIELLTTILEERPETPVIVATGVGEIETAVSCMRAGAFDYLVKPIDSTRLVTSARHAIEKWETAGEIASLREGFLATELANPDAFKDIVTSDPGMHAIFRYAEAIAPTSLPVLVTGETGVGKELFARAIHTLSGRSGSFVPVNVAGLDDTLFADTLFGHVKGAYTGADSTREGMVGKADSGTLFLDEIGDLAAESQIKLLRLLQEREYYPLGTDRARPTTARFIFATNLDVAKATEGGKFRKDLLYRLRSHHLRIPPLRERRGDIAILVEHFFGKASRELHKAIPTAPKELIPLLASYAFPGNVRELEGLIFDALVRHTSRVLSLESFRQAIGQAAPAPLEQADGTGERTTENLFSGYESLPTLKTAADLLIEEVLRRAGGNQAIAARQLGLTRTALNRRLNRNP